MLLITLSYKVKSEYENCLFILTKSFFGCKSLLRSTPEQASNQETLMFHFTGLQIIMFSVIPSKNLWPLLARVLLIVSYPKKIG